MKALPITLDETLVAATTLAGLLAEENARLAALDFAGATALLPRKADALAAFSAAMGKAGVKAGNDARARDLAERLPLLATENRRLLARGIDIQRRVARIVAEAARGARSSSGYSGNGATLPATVQAITMRTTA